MSRDTAARSADVGVSYPQCTPHFEILSPNAQRNVIVVSHFFEYFLRDRDAFFSLWTTDAPSVVTPILVHAIPRLSIAEHHGWDAVRAWWEPIFRLEGTFAWTLDELIVGQDESTIVVRSRSKVDVLTPRPARRRLQYDGRYVQIFRFTANRVQKFEEYFDSALLNSVHRPQL